MKILEIRRISFGYSLSPIDTTKKATYYNLQLCSRFEVGVVVRKLMNESLDKFWTDSGAGHFGLTAFSAYFRENNGGCTFTRYIFTMVQELYYFLYLPLRPMRLT